MIVDFNEWLQETKIPRLLLAADPGGLILKETANLIEISFLDVTRVDIGKGLHYVQEDAPHLTGKSISEWYGMKYWRSDLFRCSSDHP
jgi:haloalkane dehalogenase